MASLIPSTLVRSDAQLATLVSETRREIAATDSIKQCVNLRDRTAALSKMAKTAKVHHGLANEIATACLEAERQAGRMLKELRLVGGNRRGPSRNEPPTLESLGIAPNESSRWQRLADVSEEDFRRYVASTTASGHIVSSDGLLRVWRRLHPKSNASRHRRKSTRSADSAAIGGEVSEILGELEKHRQTLASLLEVDAISPRSKLVLPILEARYAGRLLCEMEGYFRSLTKLLAGGRCGTRTPCEHRIA